MHTAAKPDDRVLFEAVVYPHRSLSKFGFLLVMGLMAVCSFTLGTAFYLAGAWPVLGFFGLDILLIYGAFKLSYRAARVVETVALTEDTLMVRRVSPRGRVSSWTFQPFWVQVKIEEDATVDSRLVLSSHGRHVALGDFLLHEERVALAKELRGALAPLKGYAQAPAI